VIVTERPPLPSRGYRTMVTSVALPGCRKHVEVPEATSLPPEVIARTAMVHSPGTSFSSMPAPLSISREKVAPPGPVPESRQSVGFQLSTGVMDLTDPLPAGAGDLANSRPLSRRTRRASVPSLLCWKPVQARTRTKPGMSRIMRESILFIFASIGGAPRVHDPASEKQTRSGGAGGNPTELLIAVWGQYLYNRAALAVAWDIPVMSEVFRRRRKTARSIAIFLEGMR